MVQSLLFRPRNNKSPVSELFFAWEQLEYVLSHKYLGEDGNCEADIKRQLMKFYAEANTLLRKFGKYSDSVKLEVFRAYCTNLYCGILA